MIDEYFLRATEYAAMVITSSAAFSTTDVTVALIDVLAHPESTTTWVAPSVATQDTTTQVTVKVLIGTGGLFTAAVGTYALWAKVVGTPEILFCKAPQVIRVI